VRLGDALIGTAFTAGGAAILAATLRFPHQGDGSPGPALFPQVLAVLMLLFGASLAIIAVRGSRRGPAGDASAAGAVAPATARVTSAGPAARPWARGVGNALAVFAAIVVFMVAAPPLGFLLTSAIILFGLTWWLGTPPLRAALAAAGMTLFVYVVFGKVLRVPLPLGVLWF
jgi:putative tricarboxylic transport membrane protein